MIDIYRAWNTKKEVMLYESIGEYLAPFPLNETLIRCEKEGNILMRYIELDDKDRVKVFVGDIVEQYCKVGDTVSTAIFEIRYVDRWKLDDECIIGGGFELFAKQNELMNFTVIGNKFMNPELSKKTS